MKRILIIGAGVAGLDVYKEAKRSPGLGLKIVGFIDDDPTKKNKKINGVKILGQQKDLKKLLKSKKIDEVIIAIPSADGDKITEYINICSDSKVAFRVVPRVKEIIEGKAYLSTLRRPKVEDLLGRPVVQSDIKGLKKFFSGKIVLITGAAGSIGSELSRQVAAYRPKKIILVDWWENGMFEIKNELNKHYPKIKIEFIIANIQDKNKIKNIFEKHIPNYVFHAAAYKHVPLMEDNPEEAVKNNIFGTLNVAKLAIKHKASRFIVVSSDKAANPKNVMGATKLVTEAIGKKYNGKTKFISVRFGNVLGSFGSVVPIFEKQIREGGPVGVTDKRMTRYFMTIPEAVQLILKAASMGRGGELFVLDMGEPVKILDLANKMIRLHGFVPGRDIKIEFTGIRKGEKLFERLFTDDENLSKTSDSRIFISESMGFDLDNLNNLLSELKTNLSENRQNSRKILKKYIHTLN